MKYLYVLLLNLFLSFVFEANYYVAPDGDDSDPGTIAQPWGTLEFALLELSAGDTLNLRGASYPPLDLDLTHDGDKGSPIIVHAYQNEVPIVGDKDRPLAMLKFLSAKHWAFDGITF